MSTQKHVILLGNSIFMGGVAASLALYPDLVVTQVGLGDASSEIALSRQRAPVVIYDLCTEFPAILPNILCQNPEVTLIGLDPNDVFVRNPSGDLAAILSMHELAEIIRSNPSPAANL